MYVLWGHCKPPQHTATRRNTPHRASLQHTATSCTAEFVSKEQLMRKYLMYVIFKIARILLDTHKEIKHMCSAQMRTQYKIDFKKTFLFMKKWVCLCCWEHFKCLCIHIVYLCHQTKSVDDENQIMSTNWRISSEEFNDDVNQTMKIMVVTNTYHCLIENKFCLLFSIHVSRTHT